MNEKVFFDTDCISAFLWIGHESIIEKLDLGKIKIPEQVYKELSNPSVKHLKARIDQLIEREIVDIVSMEFSSSEYSLFYNLCYPSNNKEKRIGSGEAACIALAKEYNGIVASNNLRDIKLYIDKYKLKHLTTGDILYLAHKKGLISLDEGNEIWQKMLAKRRKLGYESFTAYLMDHRSN